MVTSWWLSQKCGNKKQKRNICIFKNMLWYPTNVPMESMVRQQITVKFNMVICPESPV